MPQLDLAIFSVQLCWLLFSFFLFYSLVHVLLYVIGRILFIRIFFFFSLRKLMVVVLQLLTLLNLGRLFRNLIYLLYKLQRRYGLKLTYIAKKFRIFSSSFKGCVSFTDSFFISFIHSGVLCMSYLARILLEYVCVSIYVQLIQVLVSIHCLHGSVSISSQFVGPYAYIEDLFSLELINSEVSNSNASSLKLIPGLVRFEKLQVHMVLGAYSVQNYFYLKSTFNFIFYDFVYFSSLYYFLFYDRAFFFKLLIKDNENNFR